MDVIATTTIDVVQNLPPTEVTDYLRDRGWMETQNGSNSSWWHNQRNNGLTYEWYEALSYEMFSHLYLMKTAHEGIADASTPG